MDEFKKHPILILTLILLLFARFVVTPIIDWQDEKILKIKLLDKRLTKGNNALTNRVKNEQSFDLLTEQKKKLTQILFKAEALNTFQLSQQLWFEGLLKDSNFSATSWEWQPIGKFNDTNVVIHALNVRFSGQVEGLPEFHYLIKKKKELIRVKSMSYSVNGQGGESFGAFKGTLTLLFYQEQLESKLGIEEVAATL